MFTSRDRRRKGPPVTESAGQHTQSHVKELRNAIDAVRISAGLSPYTAWTGWPASYTPATGPIFASHVGDMRVALDQALFVLKQTHLPTTANPSGIVQAVHFNDLRAGVK